MVLKVSTVVGSIEDYLRVLIACEGYRVPPALGPTIGHLHFTTSWIEAMARAQGPLGETLREVMRGRTCWILGSANGIALPDGQSV